MSSTHPQSETRPKPRLPGPRPLPRWRVLLHNDDVNDIHDVVHTVQALVALNLEDAQRCTLEAHVSGVALLTVTHQERAELYLDQFASKQLTVTIEPETED